MKIDSIINSQSLTKTKPTGTADFKSALKLGLDNLKNTDRIEISSNPMTKTNEIIESVKKNIANELSIGADSKRVDEIKALVEADKYSIGSMDIAKRMLMVF